LKTIIKIAAILFIAVTVQAQTKKAGSAQPQQPARNKSLHDQFSGQGYGLAGCGLGSIVFGAKPGMVQVIAATTNAYAGQTYAITTGTSNCDMPRMGQSAAVYIEANREVVMKDAARGQGETLSDLALIFNCTDAGLFSERVQGSYGQIFGSSNAYDSSRAILNTIKADSQLTASCNIAG
jgi:Protein of unknown function (DUF3015)